MKPPPSKPSPASPFELSRIYIQLYTDFCPQACANFIKLCTFGCRDHYVHSPVHRIVKGGWVQCGDVLDGSGLNSKAATASGFVPDESFSVDFGNRLGGTVGFANSGPHSSASQFFITLGPCEWMNNSFVGIGRVVQGYRALRYLNQVETNNQVPASPIEVDSCGLAPEEPTIN
jgi:cyclophilin family peptidyl-prolyl cis-trans isomerase